MVPDSDVQSNAIKCRHTVCYPLLEAAATYRRRRPHSADYQYYCSTDAVVEPPQPTCTPMPRLNRGALVE